MYKKMRFMLVICSVLLMTVASAQERDPGGDDRDPFGCPYECSAVDNDYNYASCLRSPDGWIATDCRTIQQCMTTCYPEPMGCFVDCRYFCGGSRCYYV